MLLGYVSFANLPEMTYLSSAMLNFDQWKCFLELDGKTPNRRDLYGEISYFRHCITVSMKKQLTNYDVIVHKMLLDDALFK